MSDAAVGAWVAAINDGAGAALEGIYAEASSAIAERGPACWASGRCCNFEQFGHRLYVTGLEAAYTVLQWNAANAVLTVAGVDAAIGRGGCPFQSGNLCGAHTIKPLGCRVFFCDRTAQGWQNELLEELHAKVRGLHGEGVPYEYGEWRWMLRRFGE